MSDDSEIEVRFQAAFDANGALEVTETSVETSLADFGAAVDYRERDTRRAKPAASEFGVDDRSKIDQRGDRGSEQSRLIAQTDATQRALDGTSARHPNLYEQPPSE
ncbi:hypothetical protein ACFPYI_08650 [Halomarina salina]|uniref:Uncharacterized protein n=1 Tax=Halomarina salina TaxID=1872699 RepID=A0ABD5RMH6_9EURY|nr:hypothetical protein [Halomarina salina]